MAVEKLCRETLKSTGRFRYVVSTRIDRSTADRPHFFLIYGTKDWARLKAFRQTEYEALRQHAKDRAGALERKREARSGSADLFPGHDADVREETIDQLVEKLKTLASFELLAALSQHGPMMFRDAASMLMEARMLRETNVKAICLDLARSGNIQNTWGGGHRRPQDDTILKPR